MNSVPSARKMQFRHLPIELFRQEVGLVLVGLKRPSSLTTVQSDVYRQRRLRHFLIELLQEEKPDQRDRREDLPRQGVVDFPCPRTLVEYSGLGPHVPLAGKHNVYDNTLPVENSSVHLEKAFSLDTCRSCVSEGHQSRNKTQIVPFPAV